MIQKPIMMMKAKKEHCTGRQDFLWRTQIMKTTTAVGRTSCVLTPFSNWIRQAVFRSSGLSKLFSLRKSFSEALRMGRALLHDSRVGEPDSAMIMCFEI